LLFLYYFRWVGTPEELKEYLGRSKSVIDRVEGVDFKGVFVPSSEWSFVALMEAVSLEKVLEAWRTYIKKYGPHPKVPLAKIELLFTPEELGM